MAPRSTRRAPARAPLTRERAVAAAVALADASGIDAVTMRALAANLGVEAMSLYHHLAGKEAVLDGMVDAVFAEIELPDDSDGADDWTSSMRSRAGSLRAALVRHPWALGILESRRSPGPATLRHHDAVIGACRRAGLSVEMAAHAFSLIDSYVYGFVLQELTLPFDDAGDLGAVIDEMVPADFAARYPSFAELASEFVARPGYRFDDEFAFGLDLVLDGLARVAGLR